MAKTGKLTKLKSAIKRWPSLSSKLGCTSSSIAAAAETEDETMAAREGLKEVYVGKSRRKYLLSSDTICHPIFQELIERSGGFNDEDDNNQVVVACEVVLFEHLLWMLENGGSQLGSMDELVDFYTC